MPNPEFEWIRHALAVAREAGYSEVELEHDDIEFEAVLEPRVKAPATPAAEAAVPADNFKAIESPYVGYFRGGDGFAAGKTVESGSVVAQIEALGHRNDIESKHSGEIAEVLVADGDPVEYGQVLAKVKV